MTAARRPSAGHAGSEHGASAVPVTARAHQGHRAGLVSRFLAACVDFGVLFLALAAIYATVAGARFLWSPARFAFPAPAPQLSFTVGWVVLVGYLAIAWTVTGSTYGGSLLGLRLVDRRGGRVGWWRAAGRAVACAVFPLGLFWVAVSGSNRSVHDILFGTSVVYGWAGRPGGAGQPGAS